MNGQKVEINRKWERDRTKGRDFSDPDEKVSERWTNIIPLILIKLLKFEVRVLRLNKRVI